MCYIHPYIYIHPVLIVYLNLFSHSTPEKSTAKVRRWNFVWRTLTYSQVIFVQFSSKMCGIVEKFYRIRTDSDMWKYVNAESRISPTFMLRNVLIPHPSGFAGRLWPNHYDSNIECLCTNQWSCCIPNPSFCCIFDERWTGSKWDMGRRVYT